MLAQGLTGIRRYGAHGERRGDELSVFVNSFAPAPRMLVFGAIDFAAAVARVGKFLGYHVTVCDARKVFATASRFPDADEVVVDWPHRFLAATEVDARTVICVLTHDPKFDVPLLEVALRTPAGYIGAMGSRRTHDDRLTRLREVGLTEDELARLRSPIGLDLGARTPEETAVSIAAELIQLRWGGTGQPLTATEGRIHHQFAGEGCGCPAPALSCRDVAIACMAASRSARNHPYRRHNRKSCDISRSLNHATRGRVLRVHSRSGMDVTRMGAYAWGPCGLRVAGVLLAAGEGSRFGRPKGACRTGRADPRRARRKNAPGRRRGPGLRRHRRRPDGTGQGHTIYNPLWRTGMGKSPLACRLAGPPRGGGRRGGRPAADEPFVGMPSRRGA